MRCLQLMRAFVSIYRSRLQLSPAWVFSISSILLGSLSHRKFESLWGIASPGDFGSFSNFGYYSYHLYKTSVVLVMKDAAKAFLILFPYNAFVLYEDTCHEANYIFSYANILLYLAFGMWFGQLESQTVLDIKIAMHARSSNICCFCYCIVISHTVVHDGVAAVPNNS